MTPHEPCPYCALPAPSGAPDVVFERPVWDPLGPACYFVHEGCRDAYDAAMNGGYGVGVLPFADAPWSAADADGAMRGNRQVFPLPVGWPRFVRVDFSTVGDGEIAVLSAGGLEAEVPALAVDVVAAGTHVACALPAGRDGRREAACGLVVSRATRLRWWHTDREDPGPLVAVLPRDHLRAAARGVDFRVVGDRAILRGYVGPADRPRLATYGAPLARAADLPTGALVACPDGGAPERNYTVREVSRKVPHAVRVALEDALGAGGGLERPVVVLATSRLPLRAPDMQEREYLSGVPGEADEDLPVALLARGTVESIRGSGRASEATPGWAGRVPFRLAGDLPAGTPVLVGGASLREGPIESGVGYWWPARVVARVAEPEAPPRSGLALHEIRALASAAAAPCAACAGVGHAPNPAAAAWDAAFNAGPYGTDEAAEAFAAASPPPPERLPCRACGGTGGGDGARYALEDALPRVVVGICDLLAELGSR